MNNTVRCHGRPCCRFRRTDLHRVSSVEIRTHEAVRRVEHDVSVGARDGWIHALERQQFLLRRLDIYARKTVSPVSSIGRVQEPARIEPCQPSLPRGGTGFTCNEPGTLAIFVEDPETARSSRRADTRLL